MFAQKGLNQTTMAHVAAAAGVGKGTLYAYFKSKDELFLQVFDENVRAVMESVKILVTDLSGSPAQRLKAVNEAVLEGICEILPYYGLFMEFWAASALPEMRPKVKAVFKSVYASFRNVIRLLIDDGIEKGAFLPDSDSEALASGLVGMWDAMGLQAWFDPDFDLLRAGRSTMAVFLRGISRNE